MRQHRKCETTRWASICLAALLLPLPWLSAAADSTDLTLRFEWAGEIPERWQGSITLSEGSFSDIRPLGLHADQAGSIYVESPREVRVVPREAHRYDGFDVVVRAPLDTNLTISLAAIGRPHPTRRIDLKLTELVTGHFDGPIENTSHRLFLRRAPGDALRLLVQRPHLVFAPGEAFPLEIRPHQTSLPTDAPLTLALELLRADSDEVIWRREEELPADTDGRASETAAVQLNTPEEEGVYLLRASVFQQRLGGRLVPRNLVPDKLLLSRDVQFVVVAGEPSPRAVAQWSTILEIDPVNPIGRWQRLMARIPGFDQGPLTGGGTRPTSELQQPMMALDPLAWCAYPLTVEEVGRPHVLEFEYSDRLPQMLGICLLEPDAAGFAQPLGTSFGLEVPPLPAGHEPRVRRHRVVFWPATKTPLVLLTNWSRENPAFLGKIRVLAGPDRLSDATSFESSNDQRLVAARIERPFFTENYGARQRIEPTRQSVLDDWSTFRQGGERLSQHLRYSGFNSACVTVVSQGSALYPSRLLDPSPKHDTGAFFANGEDPARKDVLEMLFRQFDRDGLKLIPVVHFDTPLPELESLKRNDVASGAGIDLVDDRGRTWIQRHGASEGRAPRYNPLDPRVQKAMRRVAVELVERYGHHPSFAGIGIQMERHGFTHFPDETWGFDPRTVNGFFEEMREKQTATSSLRSRIEYLRGPGRTLWLNWRSHKLAELYQDMQEDIDRHRAGASLFLIPRNLLADPRLWDDVRPQLPAAPNTTETMRRLGIDSRLYAGNPRIILLRPREAGPIESSVHQHALRLTLNDSPAMRDFFDRGQVTGTVITSPTLAKQIPAFEQVSPFGAEKTIMRLEANFVPAGFHNRRRFVRSIAESDQQILMDGGEILSRGGEAELTFLHETFRRLPDGHFATTKPRSDRGDATVVVRELTRGSKKYFYVVNDSPWPLDVNLEFAIPAGCALVPLDLRPRPKLTPRNTSADWRVSLEPYDLTAAVLTSADARITDWTVAHSPGLLDVVKASLETMITKVRNRAHSLHAPPPAIPVLSNPGFEHSGGLDEGWVHAEARGVSIELVDEAGRNNSRALRIRNEGPVGPKGPFAWVRSKSFATPETGRIAVSVWLRVDDQAAQPALRVAIEGKQDGEDFYRYYRVGAGQGVDRIGEDWYQFLFPFNNLPPKGLTDLRIGFDLMDTSEVLLDDVEIKDMLFRDNERQQLVIDVGRASLDLQEGDIGACRRFLEGYWPRLLLENVTASEEELSVTTGPTTPSTPETIQAPRQDTAAESQEPKPSAWNRFREKATGWIPKIPSIW